MAPADLDRVAAIERAAFSDPWPPDAFVELLGEPHVRCLVIDREDGQVTGYGIFAVAADQGEILNLAVEPALQRRGLGVGLLDAMLRAMRREGVASVHLEVRESNRAAIRLYALAGFHSVSVRRAYYRNPTEHAVTMTLDLASRGAEKG
jgi:ribosomal-protein-alanine N-acetyltransferase